MENFKRALASVAAAILVAAGLGVTASPAAAAQNCGTGSVCFYDTSVSAYPFEEREYADAPLYSNFTVTPITSWVRNQSSHQYRVYKTTGCTGTSSTIYANSAGAMNSEWNNTIRCYERIS